MKTLNIAALAAAALLAACAAGPNDNRAADAAELSANGNQTPAAQETVVTENPITVRKDTATPVQPAGGAAADVNTLPGNVEKVGTTTVKKVENSASPYQYNFQ